MSYWECLGHGHPTLAHRYSQSSLHITYRNPHSIQLPVHAPNSGEGELCQMSSEHRSQLIFVSQEEITNLTLAPPLGKHEREAVSTWPGVLQDEQKV